MDFKSIESLFEDPFKDLEEKLDKYIQGENQDFLQGNNLLRFFPLFNL